MGFYFDLHDKAFVLVNMVKENKKGSLQRQIKGAEKARTLYAMLGYPSVKDFKWMGQSNQIKDCPVMVDDIVAAKEI